MLIKKLYFSIHEIPGIFPGTLMDYALDALYYDTNIENSFNLGCFETVSRHFGFCKV